MYKMYVLKYVNRLCSQSFARRCSLLDVTDYNVYIACVRK